MVSTSPCRCYSLISDSYHLNNQGMHPAVGNCLSMAIKINICILRDSAERHWPIIRRNAGKKIEQCQIGRLLKLLAIAIKPIAMSSRNSPAVIKDLSV